MNVYFFKKDVQMSGNYIKFLLNTKNQKENVNKNHLHIWG